MIPAEHRMRWCWRNEGCSSDDELAWEHGEVPSEYEEPRQEHGHILPEHDAQPQEHGHIWPEHHEGLQERRVLPAEYGLALCDHERGRRKDSALPCHV